MRLVRSFYVAVCTWRIYIFRIGGPIILGKAVIVRNNLASEEIRFSPITSSSGNDVLTGNLRGAGEQSYGGFNIRPNIDSVSLGVLIPLSKKRVSPH